MIIDKVILNEQECDDENYDFSIPMVVTTNLVNRIKALNSLSIEQILFTAHALLLEKHEDNSNIDYLQTFSFQGIDFWAISNKLKNEDYIPNQHILTWLLPEDY